MLGAFSNVRTMLVGAVLLAAATAPAMAADFHGHNGNVFYRGMNNPGLGNRIANGGNFNAHSRMPRRETDGPRFDHRAFGNDRYDHGMTAQGGMRHQEQFSQQVYGNDVRGNRLRVIASRNLSTRRGSGISVINNSQPDYDVVSNYAGSVDVYHANGGTYISGYSDGGEPQQASQSMMRPRSKVIDVATMRDACSHENGVCVIRP